MPKVFKFRTYAPTQDDYVTSSRMATKKKIKQLGAEIVPGTEIKIDDEDYLILAEKDILAVVAE